VSLPVQEELTAAEYVGLAGLAEDAGYDTVFAGEIAGVEAFALLGMIAATTERIRLATGVVSIYTRSPALTAMGFATLASLAPGRVVAGLGTGSHTVVEAWHGRELRAPRQAMREFVEALRAILAGGRVSRDGEHVRIRDFRLQVPRPEPVPILMGSFNAPMLRLAGAIADGVVLAFCPLAELPGRIAEVHAGARWAGRDPASLEIAVYVNAYAGADLDAALERFRRLVLQYAVLPTHRRGFASSIPALDDATALWNAGERRAALALVPDAAVLELCPIGDAAHVLARLEAVRAAGATLPVLFPQSLRSGDAETPAATLRAVAAAAAAAAVAVAAAPHPAAVAAGPHIDPAAR
jgi:probable F420-dependent oxidoreductase